MSTDLALSGAQGRADRIRSGLASIAATYEGISEAVAIAYHERDWGTLGYQSWDAYVEGEFAGHLPKLDRDARRQFVGELREAGLSTRAIGSVAGASDATVRRDLAGASIDAPADSNALSPAVSGAKDPPGTVREEGGRPNHASAPVAPPPAVPPAPTIRGADGRRYPSTRPAPPRAVPDPEPASEQEPLTGLVIDPSDAQRDAELAAEMEETATRYRRNFSAAVARADDVWQFEPGRIAEVYVADFDVALLPFLREMTRWCERVEQANKRMRAGLRVVAGGRS
jgi:hypothetical protein